MKRSEYLNTRSSPINVLVFTAEMGLYLLKRYDMYISNGKYSPEITD